MTWTGKTIDVDENAPIPVDEELPESVIVEWLDRPVPTGRRIPPRGA